MGGAATAPRTCFLACRRYGPPRPAEWKYVSDIFDEVDEELRAERAKKLLQRYAGLIIGAAILLVAAVGAWKAYQWYQARETARVAEVYLTAMREADAASAPEHQAALAGFANVAAQGLEGYRTLARLRAAALKADTGDLPTALSLWNDVAADGSADRLLRDLASLEWALHQIDTGDPALVAARLAPLAAPDNTWHALAQEAQAMLALHQGKTAEARDTLKRLAQDVTAPEGVRRRANGLLAELGG